MMVNKFGWTFSTIVLIFGLVNVSFADEIDMTIAQMQAMDKITGRVSLIEVPVGGGVHFGSFSVVVRACKTRPEGEVPEDFAFVDISDKSFDQAEYNIFKGWMFSSSPAVHAVEHPIYDVWLLKCMNGQPDSSKLLTAEQLAERDSLPRLQEVRAQTEAEKTNSFEAVDQPNIQFKDSMYKEKVTPKAVPETSEEKQDGVPENLLNIRESYEEPEDEEEIVTVPADELAEAINKEVEKLSVDENKDLSEDDLSSEIDRELARHRE